MWYYLFLTGAAMVALPFSQILSQTPLAGTLVLYIVLIALVGALVGVAIFLNDALRRMTI
jgi:hypothetical protein